MKNGVIILLVVLAIGAVLYFVLTGKKKNDAAGAAGDGGAENATGNNNLDWNPFKMPGETPYNFITRRGNDNWNLVGNDGILSTYKGGLKLS